MIGILGFAGAGVGSDSTIHEYAIANGEVLIISYAMDSTGVFIVTHVYNSTNTMT